MWPFKKKAPKYKSFIDLDNDFISVLGTFRFDVGVKKANKFLKGVKYAPKEIYDIVGIPFKIPEVDLDDGAISSYGGLKIILSKKNAGDFFEKNNLFTYCDEETLFEACIRNIVERHLSAVDYIFGNISCPICGSRWASFKVNKDGCCFRCGSSMITPEEVLLVYQHIIHLSNNSIEVDQDEVYSWLKSNTPELAKYHLYCRKEKEPVFNDE